MSDYWARRLIQRPRRAWFTVGYPKNNLPRLEADITAIVPHKDSQQYEIQIENVIEVTT